MTGAAIIRETDGSYSLRRASHDGRGQVVMTGLTPRQVYGSSDLYPTVCESRSVIEDAVALVDRITAQQL